MVDKLALGQGFLSLVRFSIVIIFAGMFHSLLWSGTNGQRLGTSGRSSGLSDIRENWTEKHLYYVMLKEVPSAVSVPGTNFVTLYLRGISTLITRYVN
jgi:hypothetical protein